MTGRELDTWKPTGRPSIVADLFSTTEIASSDAAGAPIYGLGFCPDGVECRRASDFVMRWSPSGQVTGTWNIHEDLDYHGADGYVYATALAADRQGNFYVARKENFIYAPGAFHYGESNEWIEKYGSNGRLVARTPNICDCTGELAIQSLAVDPNTGDVLFKTLVGVFSLARDLQSKPEPTGIRSYPYSELAIDCRSNVYVLSVFSGGVAKYASRSPGNSCQTPAPLSGKAVTLAPPRVKTVGPRETAVVQPVTCRARCNGLLKVVTNGPSPSIIAQVRFTLPAGGGSVLIPLNPHGQSIASHGGVLPVSVTAVVPGSNVPVAIVTGILKGPLDHAADLPAQPAEDGRPVPGRRHGDPGAVPGPGRVAVAFSQSSATNSLGYLAGEWLPAAAAGAGRYTRVLTARAPGTWHVQMVSLGDHAHEGSRSGICSVTVAPGPPPPAPTLPAPSVSVADASVPEGNTGASVATVTVTLSAASSSPVSVAFTTLSGTATSGQDFAPASGRVTFPIGTTAQTIPVTVIGDTTLEPDETFTVQLSDPVNAMIARGTGTVTIKNDDLPPAGARTLSISDASVKEGNSGTNTMSFTVSLSPASTSQVKVDFATRDSSASAGSDYQAANGTLAFNPGETSKQVSVKVNGDTTVEPDEQFSAELSRPNGATIADGEGIGTIKNDDSAAPPPPPPAKPDLTVTSLSRVSDAGADLHRSVHDQEHRQCTGGLVDGECAQPRRYRRQLERQRGHAVAGPRGERSADRRARPSLRGHRGHRHRRHER